MTLAPGAQLDQMHRLARVQVEQVADPVPKAECVGRRVTKPGVRQAVVLRARDLQGPFVLGAGSGLTDLVGDSRPEVGAEALPLAGKHPVALQVAEPAVVGDDLEAVADRLPAAAG